MIGRNERSHPKGDIKRIDEDKPLDPLLNKPAPVGSQITGDFENKFNPDNLDIVPGSNDGKLQFPETQVGKTRDSELNELGKFYDQDSLI